MVSLGAMCLRQFTRGLSFAVLRHLSLSVSFAILLPHASLATIYADGVREIGCMCCVALILRANLKVHVLWVRAGFQSADHDAG